MKRSEMYCLSPMETARRLAEEAQAMHDFATTSDDASWSGRFASDACVQHPKNCPGLRSKIVEPKVPRESESIQRAGSCDAFSYVLIVCAWCQQSISWQRVQTPAPLHISHGICARCYVRVSREIEP